MTFQAEEVISAFEEYIINMREDLFLKNIYDILDEFRKYLKKNKIDYFVSTERK